MKWQEPDIPPSEYLKGVRIPPAETTCKPILMNFEVLMYFDIIIILF